MTGAELQQLLDAHCEDMKRNMPGLLFYGILSTTDGNTLSKASSNEETAKIIEEGSPYHHSQSGESGAQDQSFVRATGAGLCADRDQ